MEKTKAKKFWSLVISKVELESGSSLETIATVHAHFVYVTIMITGLDREIDLHYLTPPTQPLKLILPPWFFEKTPVDEVSVREISSKFAKIFETGFAVIPPRPADIPWHKVPPSRRKSIQVKMDKARFTASKPPERGG